MKQVIVIPARMKGTRLPGKPLLPIHGKPMLLHVVERCTQVHDQAAIYVATEDDIIADFCAENNIQYVNTGPADTALDRIKLFSDVVTADSYIAVMGDEPVVNPQDILKIKQYHAAHPDRVVFGKTAATNQEFYNATKAKVVCALDGRLLYSSRAGIPVSVQGEFVSAERAIWIIGSYKTALDEYYASKPYTKIDKIEENEIVRFLEIGTIVYCVDVEGNSWSVDVEKDVTIVDKLLARELG